MKVFINAGHGPKSNGGYDSGAVGPSGYHEATCVKAIGERLSSKLRGNIIDTYLYQSGDLSSIGKTANNWGANLFISIHCNSNAGNPATGTETYYYPGSSKGLAFASSLHPEIVRAFGRANRGVKYANFQVLRDTNMPAILVELLFINNPDEENILKSSEWQEKAAESLAIGVCKYLGMSYDGFRDTSSSQPADKSVSNESYAEPTEILKKGSLGDGVKWIQLNLGNLAVDGDFGHLTDIAVRNFQKSLGLIVDGIVGENTRNAILCPYVEPSHNLQKGNTGLGVKWLQWYLNKKGYSLVADGDFGVNTKNAVISFQKSRGLSQDGIVGPLTRNKLKNS